MSFVCLLTGLITYWRKKKDLRKFLCMLCNLCSVSVKKVEKWVSWLLVSVEMAPSEIVLEDNSLVWHSKKIWFPGHDNLRSRATPTLPIPPLLLLLPPPPPHTHTPPFSTLPPVPTYRHKHAGKHTTLTHIIRTCWPVLLRRREMLSNSAFQHSTSDYLFSFTGRFELVMYFPFSASLTLFLFSLCLSSTLGIPRSPVHEIHTDRNFRGQAFSI